VLVDLLSPLGFEVVEATDGQDCLNQVHQIKPDVILLDMVMPKMDGFEVVRRLRQLPMLNEVVVIASSASAFAYDKQKCLDAGCHGFISKPVQAEELLEQLRQLLGLKWVYQEASDISVSQTATAELAAESTLECSPVEQSTPLSSGVSTVVTQELAESSLGQRNSALFVRDNSAAAPLAQRTGNVGHKPVFREGVAVGVAGRNPAVLRASSKAIREEKPLASTQNSLVAPPLEEITILHELAMMGDIRGIQEQANWIEQMDEQFVPFSRQLRHLANGFQEKQILEFVRKYMGED
jgi:CheY-like chemotaxis protein